MSIITKIIKEVECVKCNGKGCKCCNDTGTYKEYYSYFINDKTGIAFGGEAGK